MKILFLSDIHGIIDNIDNVLPLFDDCNQIVILGDAFFCGENRRENHQYDPEYIHKIISKYQDKIILIKGNTDEEDLPLIKTINIDNHRVFLTHGHYYNDTNIELKSGDIFISGHTHYPEIKKEAGVVFLNPGSLSLPKNNSASFMLYDNKIFTIYDYEHNIIEKITIS